MRKVYGLELLDSGTYYTSRPDVIIDPPEFDSGSYAAIDSSFFKFGCGSLKHDSSNTSIMGTLTDSIGSQSNNFVMQSFWFYLDSLQPCTLTWNEKFRVFISNNNNLSISYIVDSSEKDAFQTNNVQVRNFSSAFVQANKWHFAKIETSHQSLRIGLDSSHIGTYQMGVDTNDNFFYDSGDVIRAGYDSGYTGPEHLENIGGQYVIDSDINKSFDGNIDNFHLTVEVGAYTFSNVWSNWVPESADSTYQDNTPMLSHHFDYRTAKGNAFIDSSTGRVDRLVLTDSGCGYGDSQDVGITFTAASSIDSDYRIGDNITQSHPSGTTMRGEVTHYILDSNGDSCRKLRLTHVGADDGKFRDFVIGDSIGTRIINTSRGAGLTGLQVESIKELNNISKNEQNQDFSDESDDFLDFSETNPFGDPEDQ